MKTMIRVMPVFREWLLAREADIAYGIEDLGDLRATFIEVFEREPEKASRDSADC